MGICTVSLLYLRDEGHKKRESQVTGWRLVLKDVVLLCLVVRINFSRLYSDGELTTYVCTSWRFAGYVHATVTVNFLFFCGKVYKKLPRYVLKVAYLCVKQDYDVVFCELCGTFFNQYQHRSQDW